MSWYILYYQRSISRKAIGNDIQLGYPGYIHYIQFKSKIQIHIKYPLCYPVLLS
jgi:hypothetical protein